MTQLKVGDWVRVDVHHWLRAQSLGKIVEHNQNKKGTHQFLVEFADLREGRGFTMPEYTGQLLWLAPDQLEVQELC